MLKFLKNFSLLRFFKIELDEYDIEDRMYIYILTIGTVAMPLSAIISWLQEPSLFLRVIVQLFVGFVCFLLIRLAKINGSYLKFTFNLFVLIAISYLFFPAGGVRGTLIFYLFESLILTWILLSTDKIKVYTSSALHVLAYYALMETQKYFPNLANVERYVTINDQIVSWEIHGAIIFFLLIAFMRKLMIERAKMMKKINDMIVELERIAQTDSLTKAYNRRHSEFLIANCQKDVEIFEQSHVLALFDIDNFKSINDGGIKGSDAAHATGDEALVGIVSFISARLRDGDFIGRWGGDEFIIVLKNITKQQAYLVLDRIRLEVSESRFTSKSIKITLSIGITEIRPQKTLEEVIARADKNMYKAKKLGRNNLYMWKRRFYSLSVKKRRIYSPSAKN